MWMYSEHMEPMRLDKKVLEGDIVDEIIKIIFTSPTVGTLKRKQALPLHMLVPEMRDLFVHVMSVLTGGHWYSRGTLGPATTPSPSPAPCPSRMTRRRTSTSWRRLRHQRVALLPPREAPAPMVMMLSRQGG